MDPSSWCVGKSTDWESEFEPFFFETLPLVLQKAILEQADSDTFADLSCCNKHLSKISLEIKKLHTVNLYSINLYKRHVWVDLCCNPNKIKRGQKLFPARRSPRPFKLAWIREHGFKAHAYQLDLKCEVLTSETCNRAALRFLRMESTAKQFSIKEGRILECSPQAFGALIKALRCTSITCAAFFSRKYFNELNQITFLSLRSTDITDIELLTLTANYINITADTISNDGIKQFMKDCASGARNWTNFTFNFKFDPMRSYAIAAQLGKNSRVMDKWYIDFEHGTYLIVEIYVGQLTAMRAWTKEKIWRLTEITDEQKYVADGSPHSSRYSFNRLRRNCPRIFEKITQLSKIAKKALYVWTFNNLPNLEALVDSLFEVT